MSKLKTIVARITIANDENDQNALTPVQIKYNNPKYVNNWNKVSPLNILLLDHYNNLSTMKPSDSARLIELTIRQLNAEYESDPNYDCISETYLRKLVYKVSRLRNPGAVASYISNAVLSGLGLSVINKVDKKSLKKISMILDSLSRL